MFRPCQISHLIPIFVSVFYANSISLWCQLALGKISMEKGLTMVIFLWFLHINICCGAHWKCLIEMLLMSTNNISYPVEAKMLIALYEPFSSGSMVKFAYFFVWWFFSNSTFSKKSFRSTISIWIQIRPDIQKCRAWCGSKWFACVFGRHHQQAKS